MQGILEAERAAILVLYDKWAEVDRSHRKLAARGSREQLVHVSASTLRRVLASEGLVLHGRSRREPAPHPGWPDWLEWKPNRVRAYDFTHWPRADRVSIAILDMVSRRWLGTVTSVEETSTQVEVAFTQALAAEGLLELADQRTTAAVRQALLSADRDRIAALADDGQLPLLLATSDNGAQMRSHSTREFLARRRPSPNGSVGRPPRPTRHGSRACSGMSWASGHTWRVSATPANSTVSSTASGSSTTPCGSTPASATSPVDEHEDRGDAIRQARRDELDRARQARIGSARAGGVCHATATAQRGMATGGDRSSRRHRSRRGVGYWRARSPRHRRGRPPSRAARRSRRQPLPGPTNGMTAPSSTRSEAL